MTMNVCCINYTVHVYSALLIVKWDQCLLKVNNGNCNYYNEFLLNEHKTCHHHTVVNITNVKCFTATVVFHGSCISVSQKSGSSSWGLLSCRLLRAIKNFFLE